MTQSCLPGMGTPQFEPVSPFNCTLGFIGSLYDNSLNTSVDHLSPRRGDVGDGLTGLVNVGLAFSGNPQLTQFGGVIDSLGFNKTAIPSQVVLPEIYPTNSLYYRSWAIGYPPGNVQGNQRFPGDPRIYYPSGTTIGGIWLLNCSTTVSEVVKDQLSVRRLAAAHFQQPNLAQQNVVKQLQDRFDRARGNRPLPPSKNPEPEKGLHRAVSAPVHGSMGMEGPARDVKVGLLAALDGM